MSLNVEAGFASLEAELALDLENAAEGGHLCSQWPDLRRRVVEFFRLSLSLHKGTYVELPEVFSEEENTLWEEAKQANLEETKARQELKEEYEEEEAAETKDNSASEQGEAATPKSDCEVVTHSQTVASTHTHTHTHTH
jgi:hypothetical protein